MTTRRTPRAAARAAWWRERIRSAPDGEKALGHAWSWLLSEIRQMASHRPADAERTRRELAGQIATIAEQLPSHRPQ